MQAGGHISTLKFHAEMDKKVQYSIKKDGMVKAKEASGYRPTSVVHASENKEKETSSLPSHSGYSNNV